MPFDIILLAVKMKALISMWKFNIFLYKPVSNIRWKLLLANQYTLKKGNSCTF